MYVEDDEKNDDNFRIHIRCDGLLLYTIMSAVKFCWPWSQLKPFIGLEGENFGTAKYESRLLRPRTLTSDGVVGGAEDGRAGTPFICGGMAMDIGRGPATEPRRP